MGLTKRSVDALKYDPQGKPIAWDSTVPGFGCRVFESGVKSFIVDYRDSHGRKKRLTLGRYGTLTTEEARKRARIALNKVSDGADPVEERKAKRQARTVKEMGALYIEKHAKPHKKSWRDDERRLTAKVYPALGNRPLSSIKRADILKLHTAIGQRAPFEANRVAALLGKLWNVAEETGEIPEGTPNPARKLKKFHEESRDRWVTEEEMPRLMKAISKEPDATIRTYFLLLLLLGTRKQELLSARWDQVDFTRAELRISENKANRVHVLPLCKEAISLLKGLPRHLGNQHLFPSPVEPMMPLRDVKNQWLRIQKAAELEDVSIHDLRRTTGSWLATHGVSLITISRILNHAEQGVTSVYARLADESLRTALDAHAKRIMNVWKKAAA